MVLGPLACSDLLVSEHEDVFAKLCQELVACYGEEAFDCGAIDRKARTAADADVSAFLQAYGSGCLASCADARVCADQAPFCGEVGQRCQDDQGCCGFTSGEAACEGQTCCLALGVRCDPGELCCGGEACENGFCGGVACATIEQPCRSALECCSRRCVDEECVKKTCSSVGEACQNAAECCPDQGPVRCGQSGVCEADVPVCVEGDPCDPLAPCCDQALECVAGPSGLPVCGIPGCFGFGGDCTVDLDCCGDFFCDYTLPDPRCNLGTVVCAKQGEPCGAVEPPSECCSGVCQVDPVGNGVGTCVAGGPGCQAPDCGHSVCATGGPLTVECGPAACIQAVVDQDPFCGCSGWDGLCVAAAAATPACASCP